MSTIRRATEIDAEAIARVHVTAWRETYHGMMPAAILDSLSVENRTNRWRRILSASDNPKETDVFIAVHPAEGVVGFASCGRQSFAELSETFDGEFQAIYVLKAAQRSGTGRRLMATLAEDLMRRGFRGGSLWVLRENTPARRFYEKLGGEVVDERRARRGDGDTVLSEISYGWRDLKTLLTGGAADGTAGATRK